MNYIQWGSEIRPFEIWKQLLSGLFEGQISNGPVSKWLGFSYQPFEIRTFLSGFQMVFDKMVAICPDFKWLGFRISDPIQNPDHLQLCLTIQNPDIKTLGF